MSWLKKAKHEIISNELVEAGNRLDRAKQWGAAGLMGAGLMVGTGCGSDGNQPCPVSQAIEQPPAMPQLEDIPLANNDTIFGNFLRMNGRNGSLIVNIGAQGTYGLTEQNLQDIRKQYQLDTLRIERGSGVRSQLLSTRQQNCLNAIRKGFRFSAESEKRLPIAFQQATQSAQQTAIDMQQPIVQDWQ